MPAFASWGPGVVLYFVILLFGPPIGATLPSFALAAALHVAFSRLEAARTHRSSVVAGDP